MISKGPPLFRISLGMIRLEEQGISFHWIQARRLWIRQKCRFARSEMNRNRVFISYPSDDFRIASAINEAVVRLPEGRLDTFLDKENIGGGEPIPQKIKDALKETIYFVGVATNVSRRSFEWCGLELGFYQGSFDDAARRESCLYHLSFPQIFSTTKNFKVQSLGSEHKEQFLDELVVTSTSEVYAFLEGLAVLNEKLHRPQDSARYWEAIPGWAELYARKITDAFFISLQTRVEDAWYPQGRINIAVENGDFFKSESEFPNDSQVTLSPTVYNILDIGIPDSIRPMTWAAFKALVTDSAGHDILKRIISDVAMSALPSKANAKSDYVYQGPDQLFYRVLLVKHSVYGSKRREFTFNLIRTLEKVRSGNQTTTAVVAGIVLGSKYRSLFLEADAKYAPTAFADADHERTAATVEELLQDIDRIQADAAADGLANFSSLQSLLGDNPKIKELFDDWWTVFPQLEATAKEYVKKRNAETFTEFHSSYEKFIAASRKNNREFLILCLDCYRKTL
jgi:hypothetical protein